MCLTLCLVRTLLYDSDADEVCGMCRYNIQAGRTCATCPHRQSSPEWCGLTNAPLPARRWCCHHNVQLRAEEWLDLGPAHLSGHWRAQAVACVLDLYGVEYERIDGACRVNRPALAVPLVYGVPVVHWDLALGGELDEDDLGPRPLDWGKVLDVL